MRASEFIVDSVKQRLGTTDDNGSPVTYDSMQGYSVTDFNIRCFESWTDYSRFLRSPKTSNRDTVKSWPTGVASFLSPTGLVTESKLTQGDRSTAKKFSADFKALDKRELVKIKVGNSISVMYTIIDLDRKEVELGGFVTPKTITNINLNQDKSIDTITFEDGSQFPERNELTNVGGQNITNTIFFPDRVSSSRAYTHIWMLTNALEGRKWTINRQSINEQGVTENFADGRNPQDKGDSKRHGVPTKASVSTLRKVAKQGGRKGQLAHWMANMKAGRAKAKKK